MNDLVTIENQKQITIKGATKVLSSTQNQSVVEVEGSTLVVSGSNLEVKKLDLDNKEVVFSGNISSLKFNNKAEKQPFLKRIFK